jgi:hypothetical protein
MVIFKILQGFVDLYPRTPGMDQAVEAPAKTGNTVNKRIFQGIDDPVPGILHTGTEGEAPLPQAQVRLQEEPPREGPGEEGRLFPGAGRAGNGKTLKGGTKSGPPLSGSGVFPAGAAVLKDEGDIQSVFQIIHSGTTIGKRKEGAAGPVKNRPEGAAFQL